MNLRIKMVGMNFQKPSIKPKENDVVRLKLERDNPVDKDAIAITNKVGERIGYVATKNTVSEGNRKNGCIDNIDLKNIIDIEKDDYTAIISKERGYFGFIDVTVSDI